MQIQSSLFLLHTFIALEWNLMRSQGTRRGFVVASFLLCIQVSGSNFDWVSLNSSKQVPQYHIRFAHGFCFQTQFKTNNLWIRRRIIHIDYRIFANNEIRVTKRILVCLIHQWFLSSPYKGFSWLHLIVWLRYGAMLCTLQHRCVQAFYDARHTVFF